MKTKHWLIIVGIVLVTAIVFVAMWGYEHTAHAKTKAECEKREALIKQADDYADSVERSLEAERQVRADLEYQHEELIKKYNAVRGSGKRATDYAKLPDAARADSLRDGILRAVRQ